MGCNLEILGAGDTGALRNSKRPAAMAARIQLRRMISPIETTDQNTSARFAHGAIMAGDSCDAMRGGESDITNWSIVLDCGEEATSRSLLPHEPRESTPRGTLTPSSTRTSMT